MFKKIYPKVKTDDGLSFAFSYKDNYFLIRFAGTPIFLLEKLYNDLGGKDFMKVYDKAKTNPKLLTKEERLNLDAAKQMSNLFLNTLADIETPLVVYASKWKDGVD